MEEIKISKKRWIIYEKIVATYVQTFCTIEGEDYSNPMMFNNDLID